MTLVLVDTGAIYAAMDASDPNHAPARSRLRLLKQQRAEPLLTNFVLAETHALLLARSNAHAARRWLSTVTWRIERVSASDEYRAREIILGHIDKTYSY